MVAGGRTRSAPRAALVDRTVACLATHDHVGWDDRSLDWRDDRAPRRTRAHDAPRHRIGAVAPWARGRFALWRSTRAASTTRSDPAGIQRGGRIAEAIEARSRATGTVRAVRAAVVRGHRPSSRGKDDCHRCVGTRLSARHESHSWNRRYAQLRLVLLDVGDLPRYRRTLRGRERGS